MKSEQRSNLAIWILATCLGLGTGCREQPARSPAVVTNTQYDISHDHRHFHREGDDHEHKHLAEFAGAHEHPHSHNHRHGRPKHGGQIIAIDHSSHSENSTNLHAEIMPISGDQIVFFIVNDSGDGELVESPIAATPFSAIIFDKAKPDLGNQSVTFFPAEPTADVRSSAFSAKIPSIFLNSVELEVVVEASISNVIPGFEFVVTRG